MVLSKAIGDILEWILWYQTISLLWWSSKFKNNFYRFTVEICV